MNFDKNTHILTEIIKNFAEITLFFSAVTKVVQNPWEKRAGVVINCLFITLYGRCKIRNTEKILGI